MKIKLSTIVLSLLLILAIITICVMIVKMEPKTNNLAQTQVIQNSTSQEQDNTQIPKYDAEKNITVNKKKFKISVFNEVKKTETSTVNTSDSTYKQTIKEMLTKIYLNDKEIKSFEYTTIFENEGEKTYNYSDMIKLNTILGNKDLEKEYIIVTFNQPTVVGQNTYFMIINQEEKVLDTILANRLQNVSIETEDGTVEPTTSWKLNKDCIIYYEMLDNVKNKNNINYKAAKYKVTVNNDFVFKELNTLYSENEGDFSGR